MNRVRGYLWIFGGVGAAVAAATLILWLFVGKPLQEDNAPTLARFSSAEVGMTDEEVERRLGEPWRVYHGKQTPADYYVDGYSHKRREVTGKVYIYTGGDLIAYVYFDESDRVEDVFIGGS